MGRSGWAWRWGWLAGLSVVAACQGSSSEPFQLGPTDANVAGRFSLAAINSNPLPVPALQTTTEDWALTSDTLSIADNGQWTETTVYLVTQIADGSTSTRTSSIAGTYTIVNQRINFLQTSGGSATFTGSVQGNTLTLLYQGSHFMYVRT
jgi:hypothetical protein